MIRYTIIFNYYKKVKGEQLMFRVQNGHINPRYVEFIGDIQRGLNHYDIKTSSGEHYISEEFSIYEQAVANRGILIRLASQHQKNTDKNDNSSYRKNTPSTRNGGGTGGVNGYDPLDDARGGGILMSGYNALGSSERS
jgi:hypothetical protein